MAQPLRLDLSADLRTYWLTLRGIVWAKQALPDPTHTLPDRMYGVWRCVGFSGYLEPYLTVTTFKVKFTTKRYIIS